MARPTLTAEQKQKMRSEIRAAAIRIINRRGLGPSDTKGYDEITIRDVIQEANISIGTFYKYFKNREELGQALWAEPVEKLRIEMQSDIESISNPADKIEALLQHYVRFSVENRRVFRGAFLFVRPDRHPTPEPMDLKDEVFYRNLCEAFVEGQEQGIFKTFVVHDMAQLFWAAIHGSLALPVNLDRYGFDNPQTLSSNMVSALLDMIKAG